jgi:hypothetical protein
MTFAFATADWLFKENALWFSFTLGILYCSQLLIHVFGQVLVGGATDGQNLLVEVSPAAQFVESFC